MRHLALLAILTLVASSAAASSYIVPTVSPTAGGGTAFITASDDNIGCDGTCAPPRVLFDGIASPDVQVLGPHQVSAVIPAHAAEAIVNVEVITPAIHVRIDKQFAYADPREALLVPLSLDAEPGYGGSKWTTELWVHNNTDRDQTVMAKICDGLVGLYECPGDPLLVHPNSSRRLPNIKTWSPFAIGVLYFVPQSSTSDLSFDLRLVDETHPETSATSIPVIRHFEIQKAVMLNVPNDVHSRTLLRIYNVHSFGGKFAVHVYDLDTGERLANQLFEISVPTDLSGPELPAYSVTAGDIFNVPQVRQARALRVEIESVNRTPFWAMISVTDNVTQHVTIITPGWGHI
jgi:hypothetical protein